MFLASLVACETSSWLGSLASVCDYVEMVVVVTGADSTRACVKSPNAHVLHEYCQLQDVNL